MPPPAMKAGFDVAPATASASTAVVVTRLSRMPRAHFEECGLPAVGVPARLTTTSASSMTALSTRPGVGVPAGLAGPGLAPYQRGDVVAATAQRLAEVATEEARGSGDHDLHVPTLARGERPDTPHKMWCAGTPTVPHMLIAQLVRPVSTGRGKREPGEIPGLPRSGEWERQPSRSTGGLPRGSPWEATASRGRAAPEGAGRRAHESEDLPARRTRRVRWSDAARDGRRLPRVRFSRPCCVVSSCVRTGPRPDSRGET